MSARPFHMLHLTVLNPALHTRIFHKLAWSQQQQGWKVSIAGQHESPEPFDKDGIRIYPHPVFRRLSGHRWLIRRKLLRLGRTLRPDGITIHSPELIGIAHRIHRETGANIIYDVHEDYAANILHTGAYPGWIKGFLAKRVRKAEQKAVEWLEAVHYAEECYWDILNAGNKGKILPNLFPSHLARDDRDLAIPAQPYYLVSGTLCEERGTLAAVDLWEQLYPHVKASLVLAGYAPEEAFLSSLRSRIISSPLRDHIRLIGGEDYVPYPLMVALIRHCDAGIALYQALPHLIHKIPTKYYEFLALQKPLLYSNTGFWAEFAQKHPLGVGVGKGSSVAELIQALDRWAPSASPAQYEWTGDVES